MAVASVRERLGANRVRPSRLRIGWVAGGIAFLIGAVALGVFIGPVGISPVQVLRRLAGLLPFVDDTSNLSAQHEAILVQLRLPRVVLAAMVGGTLAISGAAYQGAFRNPLADPYLLGAAAGAGLGATIVIAYTSGGLRLRPHADRRVRRRAGRRRARVRDRTSGWGRADRDLAGARRHRDHVLPDRDPDLRAAAPVPDAPRGLRLDPRSLDDGRVERRCARAPVHGGGHRGDPVPPTAPRRAVRWRRGSDQRRDPGGARPSHRRGRRIARDRRGGRGQRADRIRRPDRAARRSARRRVELPGDPPACPSRSAERS